MKVRKELAVLGCALIGAGFGYADQANNQSDARARVDTIEGCVQSYPYDNVVSSALKLCLTQGLAGGKPISAGDVEVGEPRAELETYENSQHQAADSTNLGEIAQGAAIGGIAGIILM